MSKSKTDGVTTKSKANDPVKQSTFVSDTSADLLTPETYEERNEILEEDSNQLRSQSMLSSHSFAADSPTLKSPIAAIPSADEQLRKI